MPVKDEAEQKPKVQCKAGHGPECAGTGPSCQLATVADFTQWRNHVSIMEALKAAKDHGPWLCGKQSHTPTESEESDAAEAKAEDENIAIVVEDSQELEDSQFPQF